MTKWDFYINGQGRCVGTIVSGTLEQRELMRPLAEELEKVTLVKPAILREAECWLASAVDWQSIMWDGMPEIQDLEGDDLGRWYDNRMYEIVDLLFSALYDLAPEGYHFGAHPGDGSDFGWWRAD